MHIRFPARSRIAVITILLGALAHDAAADRLVAGGATLDGKVQSITGKGVEFQPSFAKDPMLVPWENVQDLSTEGSEQVLYGEDQEVDAPITSYTGGQLHIGDAVIDPKTLVSVTVIAPEGVGFRERVRSSWRYWHGGVDVGLNVQRATIDNLGALLAVHALRSKDKTRLILGADYRYANERDPDNAPPRERRTKDSASAIIRGEYDITKTIFAYGSSDFLYDAIQNLSLRAVPKAGVGYVLWQREPKEGWRDFVQVELGGGWVYEKYQHDLGDDNYFTVAMGAAAAYLLPRGATFDWRFDYLPSVSDFTGDYVVRTAAGLTIPVIAPLSLRLSIADTYDSKPSSSDIDKNSLLFDTLLTVAW